jgi:hypothetical protein
VVFTATNTIPSNAGSRRRRASYWDAKSDMPKDVYALPLQGEQLAVTMSENDRLRTHIYSNQAA